MKNYQMFIVGFIVGCAILSLGIILNMREPVDLVGLTDKYKSRLVGLTDKYESRIEELERENQDLEELQSEEWSVINNYVSSLTGEQRKKWYDVWDNKDKIKE